MLSIKVIAAVGTVAQLLSCSSKQAAQTSIYAKAMQVSYINEQRDLVVFQDHSGYEYGMFGIEDWMVGDLAAVMMDDAGTPDNIEDDIILTARYSGWDITETK